MSRPDRWLVVTVRSPEGALPRDLGARLSELLVELGAPGVEELEDALRGFLPPDVSRRRVRRVLRAAADEGEAAVEVSFAWLEGRDWSRAWRRRLAPRRVGRGLVVAPGGSDPDLGPEDVLLRLDPGRAFGTGEHGTTRGVLRLLEERMDPGDLVLDVGTGSGILAVAAAALGARRVVALEKDRSAVRAARENAERNDVEERVELVRLEVDPAVLSLLEPMRFDVICANLSRPLLTRLVAPLRRLVTDEGGLVIGGILQEEAERLRPAVRRAGWRVARTDLDEGWWNALLVPHRASGAGEVRAEAPGATGSG